MGTSPSTQAENLEVSSSEDEVQQWVDEQSEEGDDIFKMLDFDFMPMGIDLVGDKIKDTSIGEPQQEDLTQMLPDSQGLNLSGPCSLNLSVLGRWLRIFYHLSLL